MYNSQDVHLQETEYLHKVQDYLHSHYGKCLDDLAVSVHEVCKALHDHLLPHEYVDRNAPMWGIKLLSSAIQGTAKRIIRL